MVVMFGYSSFFQFQSTGFVGLYQLMDVVKSHDRCRCGILIAAKLDKKSGIISMKQ